MQKSTTSIMKSRIAKEIRSVVLNFRFSDDEDYKLELFMRRNGYCCRSEMLRDAILYGGFIKHAMAEQLPALHSVLALYEGLVKMEKQLYKIGVNTKQIIRRYEYFASVRTRTNDKIGLSRLFTNVVVHDVLASLCCVLADFSALCGLFNKILQDKSILELSDNTRDCSASMEELRSEFSSKKTSVERKVQILRILFKRADCLNFPDADRDFYYEFFAAEKAYEEKSNGLSNL